MPYQNEFPQTISGEDFRKMFFGDWEIGRHEPNEEFNPYEGKIGFLKEHKNKKYYADDFVSWYTYYVGKTETEMYKGYTSSGGLTSELDVAIDYFDDLIFNMLKVSTGEKQAQAYWGDQYDYHLSVLEKVRIKLKNVWY